MAGITTPSFAVRQGDLTSAVSMAEVSAVGMEASAVAMEEASVAAAMAVAGIARCSVQVIDT